jgi:hypothetical protein
MWLLLEPMFWRNIPPPVPGWRESKNRSVLQLLVTANFVPRLLILSSLMMDVMRFSKMLILTPAIQRHIAEDDILYIKLSLIFNTLHHLQCHCHICHTWSLHVFKCSFHSILLIKSE